MWAPPRWQAWNLAAATSACWPTSVCPYRRPPPWIQPAWWIWPMASRRCGSGAIRSAGPPSGSSSFPAAAASGNCAPSCTRPTGPSLAAIRCYHRAPSGIWASCCRPCAPSTWPAACWPAPRWPICWRSRAAAATRACAASSICSYASTPRSPPSAPPPSMAPPCWPWARHRWGSGTCRAQCRCSASSLSRPWLPAAASCECGIG